MSASLVFDLYAKDRASKGFKDAGDAAQRASGKVANFGRKLGLAVAAGAAIAGVAAVRFAGDAIGAASDLSETMNKTDVVFGKASKGVVKWSEKSAKSLGLSQQAALAYTSQFGDMFAQLGAGKKVAAKTSEGVVQLATDLGSFHNLGTDEVLDKIAGAMRGEYDAIQKIIPGLSDARVKQEAMRASGKTSATQLTEQEKAMAALSIITKDGSAAANDFAETSGGLANQQKILSAQFENVKSKIGEKLLPVAVKVVAWINDKMIPGAAKLWGWLKDKLGPAFATVGDFIRTKVVPAFSVVSGFIADKVIPAFGKVRGFIVDRLAPALRDLKDKYLDGATKGFQNAKGSLDDIRPFLDLVGGALRGLGKILTKVIIPAVGEFAKAYLPVLGDALKYIAKGLGKVGEAGKWMWNNVLQPVFSNLAKAIGRVSDFAAEMLRGLSKAPGMGWAKKAAADLQKVADKAYATADGIKKIPSDKTVTIKYLEEGRSHLPTANGEQPPVRPASPRVGKQGLGSLSSGREGLVPAQPQLDAATLARAFRDALAGARFVIQGGTDSGRQVFLQTGTGF